MLWDWMYKEDLQYIYLPAWEQHDVTAVFTTRKGGLSEKPFDTLNLGLHVGDQPEKVIDNRCRVAAGLGISLEDMVCAEQVHGTRVALVTSSDRGKGSRRLDDCIPGCDAMISNTPGVYLTAFFADCLPVYFFDPVHRAVGLAHAGWKGTVGGIARSTLEAMQKYFQTRPEDVLVFIGPGIGPECYPVDEERYQQVLRTFTFGRELFYSNKRNKGYHWDLRMTNRLILLEMGVQPSNLLTCELCTSCYPEHFFSYRRSGGMTGRMAAVLGIRE